MTTPTEVLSLRDVTKTFGTSPAEVRAVDNVTLSVPNGELVIVMGPSGSGKTTLLQLLGGLLTPSRGEVRIRGQNLTALPARRLAALRLREVGFIFQSFNLFASLTAVENVALPAALAGIGHRLRAARAADLLDRVGLGHRLGHRPEQLSGGEKQRVAVARALVNDPPVLLADEPTANLDSGSGYQVMHLLADIAARQDKTVVMVTHDHRITTAADRLLWLEDGRLHDRDTSFATAADPVCGMDIVVDRAAATRTLPASDLGPAHLAKVHPAGDTVTFYFCSQVCVAKFDTDPRQYARPVRSAAH